MELKEEARKLKEENEELKQINETLSFNYDNAKATICDTRQFNERLIEEKADLRKLLEVICDIDVAQERNSVQELIQDYINALEMISDTHYSAYQESCILSDFYNKYYKEDDTYDE